MNVNRVSAYGFLGLLLLLAGCYSFSQTSLPRHIKTIVIREVENHTLDPALGDRLRQGFQDLFLKAAPNLRQINAGAHSELFVVLLSYSNKAQDFDRSGTVERYRVDMKVDVLFRDMVKNEVLYEGKNLLGTGYYDVSKNESELRHGQERALEQIQDLIINNVLSDW